MKRKPTITTIFKQLQNQEPVAFGGFSELYVLNGRAVKVLEDTYRRDVLEECWKQKLAADAGLAPQVYTVAKGTNKMVVEMDLINTDRFYHPDNGEERVPCLMGEMDDAEMIASAKLYARLILADVLHCDFHGGNIFLSDDGEAMAIDFGIAEELSLANHKQLKRAAIFLLPVVERLDMISEHNQLMDAINGADELRALLPQIAKSLLSF